MPSWVGGGRYGRRGKASVLPARDIYLLSWLSEGFEVRDGEGEDSLFPEGYALFRISKFMSQVKSEGLTLSVSQSFLSVSISSFITTRSSVPVVVIFPDLTYTARHNLTHISIYGFADGGQFQGCTYSSNMHHRAATVNSQSARSASSAFPVKPPFSSRLLVTQRVLGEGNIHCHQNAC